MSFSSTDPAALLSDRSWRLRHSAWLLAPILGVGAFGFVGFVYCALRVRNRKFSLVAGFMTALSIIVMVLAVAVPSDNENATTAAGFVYLLVWGGQVIYGVVLDKHYLRWRAARSQRTPWYSQHPATQQAVPLTQPTGVPNPPATPHMSAPAANSQPASFLGVNASEYYGPTPFVAAPPTPLQASAAPVIPTPPDAPVDVNAADTAELVRRLRVDEDLAARVVEARTTRGGFANLADLVAAAGLSPHELIRFRDKVSFGTFVAGDAPTKPTQKPGPSGARILDI